MMNGATVRHGAGNARFSNRAVRVVRVQPSDSKISNTYILIILLIAMGCSAISVYSVIIVLFGLLPGMVAIIVDQDRNHFISKIVLNYNAIGIVPYIFKIFQSANPNNMAISLIIDPRTWMLIFSSAALGWLIYWAFPQAASAVQNVKSSIKVRQLEIELEKLSTEWGEEIRSGVSKSSKR